jgi:cell division protein FtsI (penicillin-binding protein 3)
VIRDDGRGYGELPVHSILSLSSNVGCAKISLKLGAEKYRRYLTRLGFGQPVGLHVAESKGIVHSLRNWSEVDTMSIGFGQGIAVTTLQLAQAFLTLGNGGVYRPLRLLQSGGEQMQGGGQRIFSEKVCREVLDMMYETVEQGTGKRAAIPGLRLAGKTGTAQKADKRGSYGNDRTASFVGFVPADAPRYMVVVVIDEPRKNAYGGVVAAPVFRNMVVRTLAYHGAPPQASPPGVAAGGRAQGRNGKIIPVAAGRKKPTLPGMNILAPELDISLEDGEYRHNLSSAPGAAVSRAVPDVVGKSVRRAVEMFMVRGIVPIVRGEGSTVVRQTPGPGEDWPASEAGECVLWIS